jgi:Protein of unknown function (DUF2934)
MAKSVKKPGAAPKAAAKTPKSVAINPAENKSAEKKSAGTQSTGKNSSAKKPVASANGTSSSMSHDQVALLAHRFFEERGRRHGHHEEDWFRAEQELRAKAS